MVTSSSVLNFDPDNFNIFQIFYLLAKDTHTHTHIYIYIYLYLYKHGIHVHNEHTGVLISLYPELIILT
jgi:hypothetical protein